jgi:methionyl aminopeptidase
MIFIKNELQVDKVRKACRLVADYLELVTKTVVPGSTTLELDNMAAVFAKDNGATAAFKGYKNFPHSICASVNNEVIHGIPSNNPLQEGDILSVDYGILLDGYHGDSAITVPVGDITYATRKLLKTGQECLYKGIEEFCEGSHLNKISYAIQSHAESNGYEVVRNFVGHGIGRDLHEEPQVFNFTDKPDEGVILKRGMLLAIEPMVVEGSYELETDPNGWTARTKDGKLSAHWEHTVALTDKGTEILTLRGDGYEFYI